MIKLVQRCLIAITLVFFSISIFRLFKILLSHEKLTKNGKIEYFEEETNYRDLQKKWINEFKTVGNKHGTDKIGHQYHTMYGLFLGPLKNENLNFLEIGLGCTMYYGPGRSLLTWKEYLPNSQISILEFDGKCAENFRQKVANLYIGDQSDFNLLKQVGKTGPYDVIIDDGGHTRRQQINSLIGLFPHLKPNGIYVIEDIFTSYFKEFNDHNESALNAVFKLIKYFNDPRPTKMKFRLLNTSFIVDDHLKYIQENLSYNFLINLFGLNHEREYTHTNQAPFLKADVTFFCYKQISTWFFV